jgi:hypothetical protein
MISYTQKCKKCKQVVWYPYFETHYQSGMFALMCKDCYERYINLHVNDYKNCYICEKSIPEKEELTIRKVNYKGISKLKFHLECYNSQVTG